MGFKENLKSELEYQGILVKELAAKCGISRNTLGNYLTGHKSLPNAETAVKIANVLGVSVEYLVNGSDSNKANNQLLPPKYRKILTSLSSLDDLDLEAVDVLISTLKKRHSK